MSTLGGGCTAPGKEGREYAQKVAPASPALRYALPSLPIIFPVLFQRVRLKLQEVVMGKAVLDAPGYVALCFTPGPPMP